MGPVNRKQYDSLTGERRTVKGMSTKLQKEELQPSRGPVLGRIIRSCNNVLEELL